jgi:hypothetical protein
MKKMSAGAAMLILLAPMGIALAEELPTQGSTPVQTTNTTEPASKTEPAAPSSSTEAGDRDDRVICRTKESVTGSMLPKRICKTRREWAKATSESQDALKDAQSKSGGNTTRRD